MKILIKIYCILLCIFSNSFYADNKLIINDTFINILVIIPGYNYKILCDSLVDTNYIEDINNFSKYEADLLIYSGKHKDQVKLLLSANKIKFSLLDNYDISFDIFKDDSITNSVDGVWKNIRQLHSLTFFANEKQIINNKINGWYISRMEMTECDILHREREDKLICKTLDQLLRIDSTYYQDGLKQGFTRGYRFNYNKQDSLKTSHFRTYYYNDEKLFFLNINIYRGIKYKDIKIRYKDEYLTIKLD